MEKQEKSKKSNGGGVVVAIVIVAVILFTWGLSSTSNDTKPISETKPSEALVSKKVVWKESFMKGCDPAKNQTSSCLCMWNKMDARWTDEELESILVEYGKTEKIPEAFTGIINECIEA